VGIVPTEHPFKRIPLMLHFFKDMGLARISHELRLASEESEPVIKLFSLGYWDTNICFAVYD